MVGSGTVVVVGAIVVVVELEVVVGAIVVVVVELEVVVGATVVVIAGGMQMTSRNSYDLARAGAGPAARVAPEAVAVETLMSCPSLSNEATVPLPSVSPVGHV
jgi:hypothetical protein